MAHPYHHSVSSSRKWGGRPEDYQAIHDFFDSTKMVIADFRHRAGLHHAQGIFMAERVFGHTLTNSAGRIVPVRLVGEQHVREDLGRIPSLADWVRLIPPERWMSPRSTLDRDVLGACPQARRRPPMSVETKGAREQPTTTLYVAAVKERDTVRVFGAWVEDEMQAQLARYCRENWELEETPGDPTCRSDADVIEDYFAHQADDGPAWVEYTTLELTPPGVTS